LVTAILMGRQSELGGAKPPLSVGHLPQIRRFKFGIRIKIFLVGFGGEPHISHDGESLEGVKSMVKENCSGNEETVTLNVTVSYAYINLPTQLA